MSARAAATWSVGRRVAAQVPLGEAHAADVDRARGRQAAVVTEHELGRAAADVDDEERRRLPVRPRSRVAPSKDSPASSSPGDDLGLDADPLEHAGDEVAAVLGVARRRRRDEPHPFDRRDRAMTAA